MLAPHPGNSGSMPLWHQTPRIVSAAPKPGPSLLLLPTKLQGLPPATTILDRQSSHQEAFWASISCRWQLRTKSSKISSMRPSRTSTWPPVQKIFGPTRRSSYVNNSSVLASPRNRIYSCDRAYYDAHPEHRLDRLHRAHSVKGSHRHQVSNLGHSLGIRHIVNLLKPGTLYKIILEMSLLSVSAHPPQINPIKIYH